MVQIFSLDIKATLQLDNPYSSYCTLLTFPFQNVGSRTVPSIEVLLSHGHVYWKRWMVSVSVSVHHSMCLTFSLHLN